MRRKRHHGKLKVPDIISGGSSDEIRFIELLPGPVFKLFQAACERGREHKYAWVWTDDGRLFARKAANGERIEIVTWADLANIVNAFSLRKQMAVVKDKMLELRVDVLSVCETWLTPNVDSRAVEVPGYKLFRNDRGLPSPNPNQDYVFGGGVACYLRSDLPARIVYSPNISCIDENEVLAIELKFRAKKLLLTSVYRHPHGNYCTELFDYYQSICQSFDHFVFVGDFNANMLTQSDEARNLRALTGECSLEWSRPSRRITPLSPTLGLTWRSWTPFQESGIIQSPLHRSSMGMTIFVLIILWAHLPWCLNPALSLSHCDNPDVLRHEFNSSVLELLDEHAPIGLSRKRRASAPWFPPALRARCNERDRMYRDARRRGSRDLLYRYRCLRKELKRDIELAREHYLRDGLASCSDYTQRWACLRRLGLVDAPNPSPLDYFPADDLMRHYQSISVRHPLCPTDILEAIFNEPGRALECEFRLIEVTEAQVLKALLHVGHIARGSSCDGVSLRYLEHSYTIIAPFLPRIFNASIAAGKYPTLWKRSTIVPLSKVPRPLSPAQTRPIANLPHLARACDRLITEQMVAYLEDNRLLSTRQSGFRRGYSTQTALLRVVEDARRAVEDGHMTISVLFDFKCAFDTLDHTVLLRRLHELGFTADALRFAHSYLSDRSQAVAGRDGPASDFLPLTSGVPQGSSPVPIFFAAFIDSVIGALRHCDSSCMLFADDLQIYLSGPPEDLDLIAARINSDVQAVAEWATRCGLLLSVPKTQAMIIASDQRRMRFPYGPRVPIVLSGEVVPYQSRIRNLGLMIQQNLSWDSQIGAVSSRVHGVFWPLRWCCRSSITPALFFRS
ncbi:uncharacterized protein LOC111694381 [Trichogramma pretiosum]|uniref:uncharacterized protein LOC111694381 n=1 Tax=Trichogramma pretiosum TaxID=7493 RepID=UPI000C719A3A|nr:uncharacterized protein LOC111694381 [Trichogramma pretiosum]